MHDGDILAADIIHDDLADVGAGRAVPEEQQVAALEGGFHAAGQHDDDGRGRAGHDGQALPDHEGAGQDEGEVEQLAERVARVGAGDG